MKCPSVDRTSQDRLLEADPGELAGAGDTPLARHVAACARCRALAARILEAHAELDAVLARSTPLDDAGLDRIMARAGARAEQEGDAGGGRPWRWAALALAAAAAAVLWLVPDEPPSPGPEAAATAPPGAPAGPDPVVGGGAAAAVFATSNPEITVVWILEVDS